MNAALWVESRPRTLSLEPKEVEHYLHEIGAPPAVRTRWQAGGQRWRESYAKLAKTYVRVGAPEGDRSWADGRVTFVLDRAGPWLLRATLLQESTDADVDWHSLFTTLTLSVRAR